MEPKIKTKPAMVPLYSEFTYECREEIKERGGKWDKELRRWLVPREIERELFELCKSKENSKYFCCKCDDRVLEGSWCVMPKRHTKIQDEKKEQEV